MSQTLHIKPAAGLIVRDPATAEPLPETGAEKPRSRYWLRRLRDGDVREAVEPRKPKAVKTTSKE